MVPDPALARCRHAGASWPAPSGRSWTRSARQAPARPSSAWDTRRRGCSTTAASANRPVVQYGCDGNGAAGVSIPAYSTLKRARNGALPLQAQRWDNYVRAVIAFINARYGGSMSIMLQVWNEPNLTSGLSVKTKVPGSSRSLKDAVASLYELERITRVAVNGSWEPGHHPDLHRAAPSAQHLRQALPGQAGAQARGPVVGVQRVRVQDPDARLDGQAVEPAGRRACGRGSTSTRSCVACRH